jgi:quercetin 2,3-dioxygenase
MTTQHPQTFQIRRAGERGQADHGWLRSAHTFSFADYYDPAHMGFRALRVINEDRVQPGQGFGTHPHRDMEILSYVLEGGLQHRDSMGNGSVIRPGDVQRMSAGTGVTHSEFNASKEEPVHFLQIWIQPAQKGLAPGYEQRHFPAEDRRGRLRLIASQDGRDGSVTVHQDVAVYSAVLGDKAEVRHEVRPGRSAWVQVARGAVLAGGKRLQAGDGAATGAAGTLTLAGDGAGDAEVLLFDLA